MPVMVFHMEVTTEVAIINLDRILMDILVVAIFTTEATVVVDIKKALAVQFSNQTTNLKQQSHMVMNELMKLMTS